MGARQHRTRSDPTAHFADQALRGSNPSGAISDVYRLKYGDCKDKAMLLMTMLDKVGLNGYPALLGTRRKIEADPASPTLTTFNHLIVALPVLVALREAVEKFPAYDPQSQILWIDPTSESHPLGELPEMDQGVYALISQNNSTTECSFCDPVVLVDGLYR